jgi:branched-chain amino acid transport system substrate-binding protein
MYVIEKMVEAAGGRGNGAKAMATARMLAWESPRGPVKIDPETRHITQNVYLRKVEKADGRFVNKEILDFGPQRDWGLVK